MTVSAQYYDSDGITQLTGFDFGDIDGGEHARPKKFGVKSTSDRLLLAVNQFLREVAGNNGIDMVTHAADVLTLSPPYGTTQQAPDIAVTATGAGGVFSGNGTRGYKVAWTTALGETIGSVEATINIDDVTRKVVLTMDTPPALAVNMKIFRTDSPGTYGATSLRANVAAATTYTDDGAALSAGTPLTTNTSAGFKVTPTLSAAAAGGVWAATGNKYWRVVGYDSSDVELANSFEATLNVDNTTKTAGLAWPVITGAAYVKVYRSVSSGLYATPSLVAQLAGGATTYTDTGIATTPGALTSGPTYGIPPAVFSAGGISEGSVPIGKWYWIWVRVDVPANEPELGNPRLAYESAEES